MIELPQMGDGIMPAKLALMLEISRKKNIDGLKIFRSQELLPVSLETRVQYGGGEKYGGIEITSSRYLLFIVMFKSPFPKIIN